MTGNLKKRIGAVAAMAALAGCVPQTQGTPPPYSIPDAGPVPPPASYSRAGLESVMGQTARALIAAFGEPDLDVREGNARKLQFLSPACVLDVYLYPRSGGGDAIVTYVDARLPDGNDVDRASCVAAIERRPQAR